MDRKKIIINEIKYWKKNRLLPEQYCNFLLTLYTEGEETGKNEQKLNSSVSNQLLMLLFMVIGMTLLGLTFLVIYFTDFSPLLQTALVIIFSGLMFFLAFFVKKYEQRFAHFFILLGALIVFLASIDVIDYLFPNQPLAIMLTVFFTCIVWLFIGKKYKLKYFTISGAIGFIIVFYFLLI
ncbi:hypothetical protein BKP35_03920 [Anaerobacillus arseniciselenatis]|uniref:DUF2157 domain-containing protein n=1 Tax=Anaerobacillus arseniciselenatis TaxID=85682 RepID=A0A1S2LVD5_9BACI|nr:hypothetical protein [Anaerobacillus arseniciselenatis]OIJ16133.1 hypothetical protein BKP35_03920 [Anaerobacillus arseniciselenatis]